MKSRHAAVIFVFITVVLDMLALGLIAPVLPKLVLSFLNNDMKRAADWNGIFLTVFAAMQFFFGSIGSGFGFALSFGEVGRDGGEVVGVGLQFFGLSGEIAFEAQVDELLFVIILGDLGDLVG